MEIGEKIRLFRLLNTMSQDELAATVETAQRNIAQIERGRFRPSGELIGKLADALNLAPLYLSSDIKPPFKYKLIFGAVPPKKPRTARLLNDMAAEIKEKWGMFLDENNVKSVSIFNDNVFLFRVQQTLLFIFAPLSVIQGSFIQAITAHNIEICPHEISPHLKAIKGPQGLSWDETVLREFIYRALQIVGLKKKEIEKLSSDQVFQLISEAENTGKKIALTRIRDLMELHRLSLADIEAFKESKGDSRNHDTEKI